MVLLVKCSFSHAEREPCHRCLVSKSTKCSFLHDAPPCNLIKSNDNNDRVSHEGKWRVFKSCPIGRLAEIGRLADIFRFCQTESKFYRLGKYQLDRVALTQAKTVSRRESDLMLIQSLMTDLTGSRKKLLPICEKRTYFFEEVHFIRKHS